MKFCVRNQGDSNKHYFVESDSYSLQENESLITDIVTIENYGVKLIDSETKGWRDKKSVRDHLKGLIFSKMGITLPEHAEDDAKFANLTADEQKIALEWFILGKESWQLALNDSDTYWTRLAAKYREWTMAVKEKRIRRVEAIVFRRMQNVEDAKDILQYLDQITKDTNMNIVDGVTNDKILVKSLRRIYIEGIDGSVEDNGNGVTFVGIKDYLDSRPGTPFSGNGFRNITSQFRTGHTADSVADECLSAIEGTW